jgi:hypothetical protein
MGRYEQILIDVPMDFNTVFRVGCLRLFSRIPEIVRRHCEFRLIIVEGLPDLPAAPERLPLPFDDRAALRARELAQIFSGLIRWSAR